MGNWNQTIRIKHLFTTKEDYESVQNSMNKIADVIDNFNLVPRFDTKSFRSIPKGDGFFESVEYANRLLDKFYDFADFYRIWVE